MLNRIKLKGNAKAVMRRSYWMMVLVSLLGGILSGTLLTKASTYHRLIYNVNIEDLNINALLSYDILFDQFPFGTFLFHMFVTTALSIVMFGFVYSIFIGNAIEYGVKRYFLENVQAKDIPFSNIFCAFKEDYWNIIFVLFIRNLKLSLWKLLFIIPGIIKRYEYQMIPYLLAEDCSMPLQEVFMRTKKITYGKKGDLFLLDLSFIGWYILDIMTMGLVHIFMLNPYMEGVYAEAYLALKEDSIPDMNAYVNQGW